MREKQQPEDFPKRREGPGEYDRHQFAKIPDSIATWEGLRLGIAEYLDERWVLEPQDERTVVVKRTDRAVTIRIHDEIREEDGQPDYCVFAKLIVPDELALQYMTFHGFFNQALERQLGMPVWAKSFISQTQEGFEGCEYTLAVSLGEPPNSHQIGLVARWMTWSILALDWIDDCAEFNDPL
jgi:hypothetical protein